MTTYHERDKGSGYDYRGARFYDSELGRFLSTDPMAAKYAAWSTYTYVGDNPVMLVDPTGMEWSATNKRLTEQFGTFGGGGDDYYKLSGSKKPDDIIILMKKAGGGYKEIARIKMSGDDITQYVDKDIEQSLGVKITPGEIETDESFLAYWKSKNIQAASVNLSAESALNKGVQVELSFVFMLNGRGSPNAGEWGVTLGVNGLAGLEGGVTLGAFFYYPVGNESLSLKDMVGFEFGGQASAFLLAGSRFQGFSLGLQNPVTFDWYDRGNRFKWRSPITYTTVYNGFSVGLSAGVVPFNLNGSGYIGYSAFLYRSDK